MMVKYIPKLIILVLLFSTSCSIPMGGTIAAIAVDPIEGIPPTNTEYKETKAKFSPAESELDIPKAVRLISYPMKKSAVCNATLKYYPRGSIWGGREP
mgnify:CR=1 FL=1